MAIYRGINGINREIKRLTRGINGVNRNIVKEFRGISGVTKKIFGEIVRLFDFNDPIDLNHFIKIYSPSDRPNYAKLEVKAGELVLRNFNYDMFIEPSRQGLNLNSFEIQFKVVGRTDFMEGRIDIYLTNGSHVIYCPINYSSIDDRYNKHLPYAGNKNCRCIVWDGGLFHIGQSLNSGVTQNILFKRISGNMCVFIDNVLVGSMGDVRIGSYYIRTIRNWYNDGKVSSYIEYIKETE